MKTYKLETDHGMGYCIYTSLDALLEEIKLFIEEGDGAEIKVDVVEMTQEEYDELPEFEGW
jgi:hypothetical protein